MSGHSKWSTIKHGKAATDARRGQIFTKLTREIIVAARQGGADGDSNFRLRMAVQRAKDSNMPHSNIDRAINRGTGGGAGQEQMVEAIYEGYGPGGTAILLQTLTDNRNRTVSDIRSTFTKGGGNLSEAGTVAWQFEQKGIVVAEVSGDEAEELAMVAIDSGADDFETEDSTLHAYTPPEQFEQTRQALQDHGASIRSSELSMIASHTVSLDKKTAIRTLQLLDQLEELDDVQRVFSNADFPDSALEQYQREG